MTHKNRIVTLDDAISFGVFWETFLTENEAGKNQHAIH